MKIGYRLDKPAAMWESAIPIGNGRLGASVFGRTGKETITINEESVWYGKPRLRKNRDAFRYLGIIRKLLMEGQVQKAEQLCQMAMTSTPKYLHPYQKACELSLIFPHEAAKEYERTLDLETAIASVRYQVGETQYIRELFVSAEHQVLVLHIRANGPEPISFHGNLNRRPFEEESGGNGADSIWISGQCGDGVRYYIGALAETTEGQIYQIGDYIAVDGASEVTLYLDCETNFSGSDPQAVCKSRLAEAQRTGYETLRQQHVREYQILFNTMSVQLESRDFSRIPVDQLLARTDEVPVRRYLTQLLLAFGRYLLISCSRSCELPANLQGIWCDSYTPPWESKYTININLQMNYWMVDSCGLSPCFEPFAKLLERITENGKETAKVIYHCRGSVAHHNVDCWGNSDVEGLPATASIWPMGQAWLALHLYEHYAYTLDREFLEKRAMPILRESVRFFYDYLYRAPDGSWLSGPSVSPENTYQTQDGQKAAITMAPAMDHQIIRELCLDYRSGCQALGQTDSECEMAQQILEHLPKQRLTADGRIREWELDYQETEPGHRHISHLFALYPGNQIRPDTPELFRAAKKVLKVRLQNGGGHTGWSRAWLICMLARLRDAEGVSENIRLFQQKSVRENLYDVHPPFQIDGNFGFCAGVVESLAQRIRDEITLLPAAPEEWTEGTVRGLRLKGGVVLSMHWDESGLWYELSACAAQTVQLRFAEQQPIQLELCPGEMVQGRFEINPIKEKGES